MNKVAYPWTVLVRAETSDSGWISTSAKVLRAAAAFATMIALFGAVAICSIGFSAFTPRAFSPTGSASVPVFPTTKLSAATSADQDNDIGTLLPNQVRQGTIASAHSTTAQTAAPTLNPIPPNPSVAQESKASGSDSALVERESPEAVRKSLERELPKAVRKNLEKGRREAERKRSRLEKMYQNHAISGEAYQKGEQKYKSEIEKYRKEMNAGTGPKNESGF